MRTMSRLVCRHIAAALCIVLLVLLVNSALVLALLVRAGTRATAYPAGLHQMSVSFRARGDDIVAPAQAEDWLEASGCAWAMLLGQQGEILWQHALPQQLNHPYTIGQIAAFTRWYLDDYPVFVSRNDLGLLVMGMPQGSITRFDFYIDSGILQAFLRAFWPLLALDGALILACCLLLGFASAKSLRGVALGIDALARGESVHLPERGMAGELAEKLNRTSRRLAEQGEAIARRDSARTEWIAGVSHDIRTPLSLILARAERLTASAEVYAGLRQEAQAIAAQCGVIRALIEDLNLTSKLQYGAQPLRAQPVAVGALMRGCVSDFLNSGQPGACTLELELSPEAGQAVLLADDALLSRALRNLLSNSVRHNPGGCAIRVSAALEGSRVILCVRDSGTGYPQPILRALTGSQPTSRHILGLHLVVQIVQAHGGSIRFFNESGACCAMAFDTQPARHV
ncbi:MAG: sensor histidine kinase [Candidatus Ventricola sp.]